MLLVVADRDLAPEQAAMAMETVLGGLRRAVPDVVTFTEPGIGATGSARQPTVMVLDDTVPSNEMAGAVAAAAEVLCIAAEAKPGIKENLGIGTRTGRSKPLWLVLVSEERPDTALTAHLVGAVKVYWTPPTPTRLSAGRLANLGKKLSAAAAVAPVSDVLDVASWNASAHAAARRRLEGLLAADDVEEYQIMGDRHMVVHYSNNTRMVVDSPFVSEQEMMETSRHLAAFGGPTSQRFDPLDPRVDMQIAGRWRLHAEGHVISPPTMVLRSNWAGKISIHDLGVCDYRLGRVLIEAVAGQVRANMVIAAPMSGGKTTLAQALLGEVPETERIDTIEDTPELKLLEYRIHMQSYERLTRDPNNDGFGKFSMADHIRDAKRSNSDKLVVGEVRGEGTMALLDAMSSGLSGCMVTIHAHPGRGVLDKLIAYASSEGAELSYSRQQIAGAVDLLVWMGRDEEGNRVIGDVTQIDGFDEATGRISTRCLWRRIPGRRHPIPVAWPDGRIEELYRSAGVAEQLKEEIAAAQAHAPPPLEGQMALEDAVTATPALPRGV